MSGATLPIFALDRADDVRVAIDPAPWPTAKISSLEISQDIRRCIEKYEKNTRRHNMD
jgi:hypothetical protein